MAKDACRFVYPIKETRGFKTRCKTIATDKGWFEGKLNDQERRY